MTRKWLCALGIFVSAGVVMAQHRWLGPSERASTTDGVWTEYPLPNPGSGPTTIALAQDGALWFTESAGNRIGRINPDGTGLREFPLPTPTTPRRTSRPAPAATIWSSGTPANRTAGTTPTAPMASSLFRTRTVFRAATPC